jgi:WD40 repeat protein
LIVGTSNSNIYFVNGNNYQVAIYSQANNSQIAGIDVQNNVLASFDVKGNMKIWDIQGKPKCLSTLPNNPLNSAQGTCIGFGDAPYVLQGFSNGDINCVNSNASKVEWSILKSHKNGVTTLFMVNWHNTE